MLAVAAAADTRGIPKPEGHEDNRCDRGARKGKKGKGPRSDDQVKMKYLWVRAVAGRFSENGNACLSTSMGVSANHNINACNGTVR